MATGKDIEPRDDDEDEKKSSSPAEGSSAFAGENRENKEKMQKEPRVYHPIF